MNFEFTNEQILLKNAIKSFTDKYVVPAAEEIDQKSLIPEELKNKLRELKIFGLPYDKKYGGAGGNYFDVMIAINELSKASAGLGFYMAVHYLGATALNIFASEEQRQKYMPILCSGEAIGSFGFTEADTGVDPRAITCTAVLTDEGYVLNGQKRFVTNGMDSGAMITWANTQSGISAFIVDKFVEGYNISKPWRKMGNHGAETVDVHFNNVKVPVDNLLGIEGKGMDSLTRGIALGKLNMCAISLGLGEAALDEATKYANQRIVRGKPMSKMQSIQTLIANATMKIEASKLMTYRAVERASQSLGDVEYESALTKLFVSDAIKEAIDDCLQVHGCYGYIEDFKIERIYRDIRIMPLIEGSNEVMRSMVAINVLKK